MLFLERAIDFVLVLRALELLGGFLVLRVLPPLVSVLGPFPPWFLDLVYNIIVYFFSGYIGSWLVILAQVNFADIVFAWVLA